MTTEAPTQLYEALDAMMRAWLILDALAVSQRTTPPAIYRAQEELGRVLRQAKERGWVPVADE